MLWNYMNVSVCLQNDVTDNISGVFSLNQQFNLKRSIKCPVTVVYGWEMFYCCYEIK